MTTQSIDVNVAGNYTVTVTGVNGCKNTSDPAIVSLASCDKPTSLKTTLITDTSAKLSWTVKDCAVGYLVRYRVTGTAAWSTITVSENKDTLNGLSVGTSYDWSVVTVCQISPLIQSIYTTPVKFTTLGNPLAKSGIGDSEKLLNKSLTAFIYPVPVINNLASLAIQNSNGNASISLSDISGKLLWSANKVSDGKLALPIARFAAGTYLLNVNNGKENVTIKFVKQ